MKRNSHPTVMGTYVRGNPKIIDLKNKSEDDVAAEVERLRQSSGRKMTRLSEPVRSDTPSIQGVWSPTIPLQTLEFELTHITGEQHRREDAS